MIDFDDWEEEDEPDELDSLHDLFDDLYSDGPTSDQLYKMYGIFLNDIIKNPLTLNGRQLICNTNRSRHPICRGKAQTFEHIITRENKIAGRRNFDPDRANKIHWIRPVLVNAHDVRIRYFERIHHDGRNQHFYWFEAKHFIIILREINADAMLITSYCVDSTEIRKFRNWYNEYRNGRRR